MMFMWMMIGGKRLQKITPLQIGKDSFRYPLYRWEMWERKHNVGCNQAVDEQGQSYAVRNDGEFVFLTKN